MYRTLFPDENRLMLILGMDQPCNGVPGREENLYCEKLGAPCGARHILFVPRAKLQKSIVLGKLLEDQSYPASITGENRNCILQCKWQRCGRFRLIKDLLFMCSDHCVCAFHLDPWNAPNSCIDTSTTEELVLTVKQMVGAMMGNADFPCLDTRIILCANRYRNDLDSLIDNDLLFSELAETSHLKCWLCHDHRLSGAEPPQRVARGTRKLTTLEMLHQQLYHDTQCDTMSNTDVTNKEEVAYISNLLGLKPADTDAHMASVGTAI